VAIAHSRRKPPRILFLIDNLRPGGAQKALLAIVRGLRDTRAEPAVWRLGGGSRIEEDFRALGVPVLGGSDSPLKALAQPFSLLRYLIAERVSLVQTFLFHSDVTGRAVGRLARALGPTRGAPAIVSSARATNARNRWWQFLLQRMTAPLADAFTAVSRRTLDFAARREGLVAERARVIPNGIDLAPWTDAPDPADARERLGLDKDAFVIGSVGRLHPQKGYDFLLDAIEQVAPDVPEAVAAIAGYGPLREHLETRCADLGVESRVRFLGYRSDVTTALAAFDVFVLPSLWEGMSNAILEAMAASKPVVATAVDGNVEQVVDGETGLLVPPADGDALAGALLKLARDRAKARRMGEAGRRRVEREFPVARMVASYLDLYARLLEEKAGIAPESWRQRCPT